MKVLSDEQFDELRSSLEGLIKPFKVPQLILNKTKSKNSLALLVSDVHVGKKTKSYDSLVFKNRLAELLRESLDLIKIHSPKEFVLILNGDIIDGEAIFPSHPYEIEMPSSDQYFLAAQAFGWMIQELAKHTFVRVIGQCGNHGRMGRKSELPYTSNWEYLLYHFIEVAMKSLVDANRVKFELPSYWYSIHTIQDSRFLITHGDAIKGGGSLGSVRGATVKWAVAIEDDWDIVCMGHFHAPYEMTFVGKRVVGNGTFVSDDDYSIREIKERVLPSQTFILVKPKNQMYVMNYRFEA